MIRRFFRSYLATRRGAAIAAVVVVALALAWPFPQTPRLWPDSASYLSMSPERMPVFTLIASALKATYLLVCVHFVLSLAAWCWLGYAIGRTIGLAVAAAFAISLPVYVWHLVVLSESISLTLLAAVLAATLTLSQRWESGRFRLWCVFVFLFAMTRVINLLVLPFLVIPFVVCGRRRFVMTALAVAVLGGFGLLYSQTLGAPLRETSLTNIYMRRVAHEKEFRNYFMSRGMPLDAEERKFVNKTGSENKLELFAASPAFETWLRERGGKEYFRWVMGRPRSYRIAWNQLFKHINGDNRWVSAGTLMRSVPRWLEKLYLRVYLPFWLWLAALLLPLLSRVVYGSVRPVFLLAAGMVVAAYIQAFVGYHGDATEEARHMMSAFFIYRITIVLLVLESLKALIWGFRRRESPDSSTN
jgi:hypothetical protein